MDWSKCSAKQWTVVLVKQGGALAGFNAWFGSMSMMNILCVWFPASWGPSVVEAIQKGNETWLAQNPVIRDPQMFNRAEVAMGPAPHELTYKIQKWNVHSDGLHPILVANARVDWLALKDDEITQQFPILREGILQDVFSHPLHGKAPNHKESQFLFFSLGVVLRHSGAIFCNQGANFGLP